MSAEKKGTGLEPNVAGLLCYLFAWVSGLIFFIIEEKDEFVRFHAMQSILLFGAFAVLWFIGLIFMWVPVVNVLMWIIWSIVWIIGFVLWIVLMVKAYQGERFKLPIVGDMAAKYSKPK
jgi:uncharacterized membrane protein